MNKPKQPERARIIVLDEQRSETNAGSELRGLFQEHGNRDGSLNRFYTAISQ